MRRVESVRESSGPRPRGRKAVSRRGELDGQPDGLDHDCNPIKSSKHSPILNPEGGGDGEGNTEGNIDLT